MNSHGFRLLCNKPDPCHSKKPNHQWHQVNRARPSSGCNTLANTRRSVCVFHVEAGRPDLIFIESAWHGRDGQWTTKISSNGPELQDILAWAAEAGVPASITTGASSK